MKEGGFEFRKWASNSVELINKINREENINCSDSSNESNHTRKVLGVNWDLEDDTIIFYFDELVNEAFLLLMTKRSILKISAKIFEPLGLISPISIQFKMLFQMICTNKFSWGDSLPNDLLKLKRFTDSEICLWWIKSVYKEWKAWVENRTNAIRVLTDIDLWRFMPGNCNPSDIGTRKGDFVDLVSKVLFWNGPSFLLLDTSGWPKPKQSSSEAFDNIENVEMHVAVSEDISNSNIRVENLMKVKNFSSLEKLLLVTSYV